jgi:hypothetical protein
LAILFDVKAKNDTIAKEVLTKKLAGGNVKCGGGGSGEGCHGRHLSALLGT